MDDICPKRFRQAARTRPIVPLVLGAGVCASTEAAARALGLPQADRLPVTHGSAKSLVLAPVVVPLRSCDRRSESEGCSSAASFMDLPNWPCVLRVSGLRRMGDRPTSHRPIRGLHLRPPSAHPGVADVRHYRGERGRKDHRGQRPVGSDHRSRGPRLRHLVVQRDGHP